MECPGRLLFILLLVAVVFSQDAPPASGDSAEPHNHSIDWLFYEESRLVKCVIKPTEGSSEKRLIPSDHPALPAIVYFTELAAEGKQQRANIMILTIILSGYFTKIELHLELAGLDKVRHVWEGKGQAVTIDRPSIFSSKEGAQSLTYFVSQSQVVLKLPSEELTFSLQHESATYHYSVARLGLGIIVGLLLLGATREPERMGVIAGQISTLSMSLLFVKLVMELALVCIDNFAFRKPVESQYIDIFVMMVQFLVVVYASFLLFPTCRTFLRWKLLLWLLFVVLLDLYLFSHPWYNMLVCFLVMLPQMKFNALLPGTSNSGDKVAVLLYVYYYANVLGFALFEDNYLYFKGSPEVVGVMAAAILIQSVIILCRIVRRLSFCITRRKSKGLNEEQYEKDSGFQIKKTGDEIGPAPTCQICFSTALKKSVEAPCGHTFHAECLDEYVKESSLCPVDNNELQYGPRQTPIEIPNDSSDINTGDQL